MYPKLPYPPRDYHICPCCSTEFGNDDARYSVEQLREMWIASGARWFFGRAPEGWNPWLQLIRSQVVAPAFPISCVKFHFEADPLEVGAGGNQNDILVSSAA